MFGPLKLKKAVHKQNDNDDDDDDAYKKSTIINCQQIIIYMCYRYI